MGLWINLLPREHFASVDTITWLGHHTGKRVYNKTWMSWSNGFFNEQLLIHYNHRILRSFATVAELSHYGAKWLNDWDDFGFWKSDVQLVTAKNLITWRGRDEARVHHFKLRRTSCGGNVIDNNKKAFGEKISFDRREMTLISFTERIRRLTTTMSTTPRDHFRLSVRSSCSLTRRSSSVALKPTMSRRSQTKR